MYVEKGKRTERTQHNTTRIQNNTNHRRIQLSTVVYNTIQYNTIDNQKTYLGGNKYRRGDVVVVKNLIRLEAGRSCCCCCCCSRSSSLLLLLLSSRRVVEQEEWSYVDQHHHHVVVVIVVVVVFVAVVAQLQQQQRQQANYQYCCCSLHHGCMEDRTNHRREHFPIPKEGLGTGDGRTVHNRRKSITHPHSHK